MTSVGLWSVTRKTFSERSKGKIEDFSKKLREGLLVVSYQVVTDPCCGLSVTFCGFILHLIGRKAIINIPEIFSGVPGFTGKTVIIKYKYCSLVKKISLYQIIQFMNPFL